MFSSTAIGVDGTVFTTSENGNLNVVNPDEVPESGSSKTGDFIYGSPTIEKDGIIYVSFSDNNLYVINPKDDSEK